MRIKLSSLPAATLHRIRNLRVRDNSTELEGFPGYVPQGICPYMWDWADGNLYLDRLTIIYSLCTGLENRLLSWFASHGEGWGELRFIASVSTPECGLTPYGQFCNGLYFRQGLRQARDWQSKLEARDGVSSEPSAAVHWLYLGGERAVISDPDAGKPCPCVEEPLPAIEWKDAEVVMKRGKGADYEYRVNLPIRAPEMIWDLESLIIYARWRRGEFPALVDSYAHVDEGRWF